MLEDAFQVVPFSRRGTKGFEAPELATGKHNCAETDAYSVGCTLNHIMECDEMQGRVKDGRGLKAIKRVAVGLTAEKPTGRLALQESKCILAKAMVVPFADAGINGSNRHVWVNPRDNNKLKEKTVP